MMTRLANVDAVASLKTRAAVKTEAGVRELIEKTIAELKGENRPAE